jgi:hypothetical protein
LGIFAATGFAFAFAGAVLFMPPNDGLSAAEHESIDDAVAEALVGVEIHAVRQELLKSRVGLCREALSYEDWPGYISKKIISNPELGNFKEIIEDCVFYIHGKQDQIEKELLELR